MNIKELREKQKILLNRKRYKEKEKARIEGEIAALNEDIALNRHKIRRNQAAHVIKEINVK